MPSSSFRQADMESGRDEVQKLIDKGGEGGRGRASDSESKRQAFVALLLEKKGDAEALIGHDFELRILSAALFPRGCVVLSERSVGRDGEKEFGKLLVHRVDVIFLGR